MKKQLRDRAYELKIGRIEDPSSVIQIDRHHIDFQIKKSSDNSSEADRSTIQIHNLSDSQVKWLEKDYLTVTLSVGYLTAGGLKRLFVGDIVHTSTRKQGTERVTTLDLSSSYSGLNHSTLSASVPPGSKVRDAIQAIADGAGSGIESVMLAGSAVERQLLYGYPLTGSPKDMLSKLARAHKFEWRVDQKTLYVNDLDKPFDNNYAGVFSITPSSGLIEAPYYDSGDSKRIKGDPAKKSGVSFRMLIDPEVTPGQVIRLEDTLITGLFKVEGAVYSGEYKGEKWYTDITATAVEKVENEK